MKTVPDLERHPFGPPRDGAAPGQDPVVEEDEPHESMVDQSEWLSCKLPWVSCGADALSARGSREQTNVSFGEELAHGVSRHDPAPIDVHCLAGPTLVLRLSAEENGLAHLRARRVYEDDRVDPSRVLVERSSGVLSHASTKRIGD
jgi:hypothetical protein